MLMARTSDVPDEIVEAATKATSAHFYECDVGDSWRDCENCVLIFGRNKRFLVAVLQMLPSSSTPGKDA
jgi:hypothetical protein